MRTRINFGVYADYNHKKTTKTMTTMTTTMTTMAQGLRPKTRPTWFTSGWGLCAASSEASRQSAPSCCFGGRHSTAAPSGPPRLHDEEAAPGGIAKAVVPAAAVGAVRQRVVSGEGGGDGDRGGGRSQA